MPFCRKNEQEKKLVPSWPHTQPWRLFARHFTQAVSSVHWETEKECPKPDEVLCCLKKHSLGNGKVKENLHHLWLFLICFKWTWDYLELVQKTTNCRHSSAQQLLSSRWQCRHPKCNSGRALLRYELFDRRMNGGMRILVSLVRTNGQRGRRMCGNSISLWPLVNHEAKGPPPPGDIPAHRVHNFIQTKLQSLTKTYL